MKALTWIPAALLLLSACGGGGQAASGGGDPGARSVADKIKTSVDTVTKTEALTEATDKNDLLGRPNGYSAAVVLYDKNAECLGGPGVDCGGVIEQWKDADAAKERVDYIKSLGSLANEYDYLNGRLVLRVAGSVMPSVAKQYEAAFN